MLRDRLPVGPPGRVAELLDAYKDAGLQTMLLWPVREPERQLERFVADVVPRLSVG